MFSTQNQVEFREVLREFTAAAYANYDSHAFAAGYLESLAVAMLSALPKREQTALIKDMIRATEKQQKELA
jgi:hypothetical protein